MASANAGRRKTSEELWSERLAAVSRLQNRVLFWLLILGSFYLAVDDSQTTVKVPVLDLDLRLRTVMASGPAILSLLTMALLGALSAAAQAGTKLGLGEKVIDYQQIGPDPDDVEVEVDSSALRYHDEWEMRDHHPGLLDMVLYRRPLSRRVFVWLRHIFDLVALAALAEASWLWLHELGLPFNSTITVESLLGMTGAILIPISFVRWFFVLERRVEGTIDLFRESTRLAPRPPRWRRDRTKQR